MNGEGETTVSSGMSAGCLKTFAIETRGDLFSNQLGKRVAASLRARKMEDNQHSPDLVLSIGGDGTLLQAFHKYIGCIDRTAFVGVHTGHLGFYADWTAAEADQLIDAISQSDFKIVAYPLLRVDVAYENKKEKDTYLALNECTIRSGSGLLAADVYIRDEKFESFRGDGLCFSTPTGSTAYNKGLSGAIIHPSLASIQLTEIASINNRIFRTLGSPVILPKHHPCQIRPVDNRQFMLSIDHLSSLHDDVRQIECGVAKEKIRFARFRPLPFWRRVRDAFIG